MNDPTLLHPNAGAGLVMAVVDIHTVEGEPIRWSFPVVQGTSTEQVRYEITSKLNQNPALDIKTLAVAYPAGTWSQPLDRDVPVIGSDPRSHKPQEGPKTAPQTPNTSYNGQNLGPLPEVHQRQSSEQDAYNDLDRLLHTWSNKHQLSSAEYCLLLSRAMGSFAMRLVTIERRSPRRS